MLYPSWICDVENSMDCFRDNVVKDRIILLKRRDWGPGFDDVIARTFEPEGSPELVIKQNKNPKLEAFRLALLEVPVGTHALARVSLQTKYYYRTSRSWTCYMTSEWFKINDWHQCIVAYQRRTLKSPISTSERKGLPSMDVYRLLDAERSARQKQEKRIEELEFKVEQLTHRIEAARKTIENFRLEHLEKKRKLS